MQAVYAQAIERLEKEGAKDIAGTLITHLKSRGRLKLLPGIVRELQKREMRKNILSPHLEVADESEKKTAEQAAKALGVEITSVESNPALIRGWRLRSKDALVDRSGKRALIDLYRRIVK